MTANHRPVTSRAVYLTVLAVWALFVGLSVAHDKQPGDTIQVVPRTVTAAFHAAAAHEQAPSATGLAAHHAHSGDAGGGDAVATVVAPVPRPLAVPAPVECGPASLPRGFPAPATRAVGATGCRGPPTSAEPA